MRNGIQLFSCIVLILFLVACNNSGSGINHEESGQVLQQLSNTVEQQSFRFDGSSSLRGDHFNHENIINFSGVVGKDRNTYLRLLTGKEENGLMEDMDLYAKGDKLFMRFADQVDWEQVSERTPLVEMEMNHWNPIAHFKRMQTMSKHIENGGGKTNISTIRVVLDDNALKNEFLENIRARLVESDSTGRQGIFKSLSTGQAGEHGVLEEADGIYNSLKQDFDDLERTVRVKGEYTIHYDKNQNMPTQLTYIQTIDYTQNGRNETEISETDIKLTRYGDDRIPSDLP